MVEAWSSTPSTSANCVVLDGAGDAAEYVVVALSAAGQELANGIQAAARLTSSAGSEASGSLRGLRRAGGADGPPTAAERFHAALRRREAQAAREARPAARAPLARLVAPPILGSTRTFQVCTTTDCDSFTGVVATARHVGERVAIYVDDDVPSGGLSSTDISELGQLFDSYLYPIDTTAFGRESDLDGNGVVAVLASDAVNALSGSCADGSVILGYFYGPDLVPSLAGSNGGEVFYTRVPSPVPATCQHTRDNVLKLLAPTFIHEFQHMISFNQRVLVRDGVPEDVWLNEGLSHFAEELGGRLIPDGPAQGSVATRQAQFLSANFNNALSYLLDPEGSFLVTPGSTLGTPAERGANWLFVRWLADQEAPGDALGTAVTRALVQTTDLGSANVEARSGRTFAELVAQWQLANYLDNLPGFTAVDSRLQYVHLNLRGSLASIWPVYPLIPDSTSGASFRRDGVLRAGSGMHVRVLPTRADPRVSLQLVSPAGGAPSAIAAARVAVARVR